MEESELRSMVDLVTGEGVTVRISGVELEGEVTGYTEDDELVIREYGLRAQTVINLDRVDFVRRYKA